MTESKLEQLAKLMNELDVWIHKGCIYKGDATPNDPATIVPEITDAGKFAWKVNSLETLGVRLHKPL